MSAWVRSWTTASLMWATVIRMCTYALVYVVWREFWPFEGKKVSSIAGTASRRYPASALIICVKLGCSSRSKLTRRSVRVCSASLTQRPFRGTSFSQMPRQCAQHHLGLILYIWRVFSFRNSFHWHTSLSPLNIGALDLLLQLFVVQV